MARQVIFKMEAGASGVKLLPALVELSSVEKCIICQTTTSDPVISNTNGRKHIHDVADIRKDSVTKRLKLLGDHEEHFVYHMTKCLSQEVYKYYILHRGRKRTPMHMMNSQAIYEACRSATLMKSFNRCG